MDFLIFGLKLNGIRIISEVRIVNQETKKSDTSCKKSRKYDGVKDDGKSGNQGS